MASLLIRQLDDRIKEKLRRRAAGHGRSMELEAREILRTALSAKPARRPDLASAIRRHIDPLGGVDLNLPQRKPLPAPVDFKQ